jgi:Zn-dependent protease
VWEKNVEYLPVPPEDGYQIAETCCVWNNNISVQKTQKVAMMEN